MVLLSDQHGEQGKLTAVGYQLMTDFHRRFLTGMDTYIPDRWVAVAELADTSGVQSNDLT